MVLDLEMMQVSVEWENAKAQIISILLSTLQLFNSLAWTSWFLQFLYLYLAHLVGCVSTSSALDQLCSAMFSMFIRWHQFSVAKCSWNRTEGVGTYRLYLAADMCCTINGATNLQVSKLIIYDIQTYIHTFRWGIVMWSLLVEVCQLRAAAASGAVKRMRLKHGAKS